MSRAGPAFVQLAPGSLIEVGSNTFQITHWLGLDSLLARNLDTNVVERLSIDEIRPLEKVQPDETVAGGKDLLLVDDGKWKTAQTRLAVIRPYLESESPTRELAVELSDQAGIHPATFYRWLDRFRQAGHLSGLVPDSRGSNPGNSRLSDELEAIIADAIERVFLTRDRKPFSEVFHEVCKICRRAGIEAPHENTVRNRIKQIPESTRLRKRGFRQRASNRFDRTLGSIEPGTYPLDFTQIDHTPVDAIVVDEEHRLPLCRPWVTLQMDILTRVVTGVVLTLEAPSTVTVALCVSHGILPKSDYLTRLGVEGDWPVWGQPRMIQSDNAREFRSDALKKACDAYGIDWQFRPKSQPKSGGHIERMIGTLMKEIQKLPGTTFSNTRDREGYNSDKKAVFTLRELEQHIIDWIVNVYHQRVHSDLAMPPIKKWELELLGDGQGRPAGLPAIPADPERLYIDFLPYKVVTVQRYGIQWDKIQYTKECLNPWINAKDPDNPKNKRKFVVRRDPRDISILYFFDPEAQVYFKIPYRNPGHPAISLWELKDVKAKLREEGRKDVDEDAIFDAVERLRQRTEEVSERTKKARRSRHRARRAERISNERKDNRTASSKSSKELIAPPAHEPEQHLSSGVESMDLKTICSSDVEPFDVDLSE